MSDTVAKPRAHWPFPYWYNKYAGKSAPNWTNDPAQLIPDLPEFDPDNEHNVAADHGIDGLGPILRRLDPMTKDPDVLWILRDNAGYYYAMDEEEARLWAFKNELDDKGVVAAACGFMSIHDNVGSVLTSTADPALPKNRLKNNDNVSSSASKNPGPQQKSSDQMKATQKAASA